MRARGSLDGQFTIVDTQDPSLRDFDGLLGMPALGITEVVFDFEQERLGWK